MKFLKRKNKWGKKIFAKLLAGAAGITVAAIIGKAAVIVVCVAVVVLVIYSTTDAKEREFLDPKLVQEQDTNSELKPLA
tara:strand:+ start:426 stop:662 length:237 start_codon:yes stop_codon:yes gene_type:complete